MSRMFKVVAMMAALLLACASAQAAMVLPVDKQSVFFSDKQGVSQVDTDTNQISLSLPLDQVVALGVNSQDGSVWALTAASLVKYAANGRTLLQLDLKTLANNFGAAQLISVDPFDGGVWLAGNKRLLHLNQNGGVLSNIVTPAVMQDFTVAQDESLWVLAQTQLLHYSAQGGLLASFNLPAAMQKTKYLAVDDNAKVIWLAGEKQLFQLNLDQPGQTLHNLRLSDVAVGLALNPQDNSVWIASQNMLTNYALKGGLLHTTNLQPYKLTNPDVLVFDYASNGLWLGHVGGLSRFDVQGNYLATVTPVNVKMTAIGKSAFVIPMPTVSLVSPLANTLINNPKPPLQLGLGALCAGQPCRFPNSYYGGYTLSALLNAQQINKSFVFDPATALSNYTPSARLPEGVNTLSAQVTDQNGRISQSLNASFTLDTIPPKFLTVKPADKSVSQLPQITIRGSVDDAQAYVVLSNYTGPGANPARQNFSYPVTLVSGVNTFNLSAYDLAGNLATQGLPIPIVPLRLA